MVNNNDQYYYKNILASIDAPLILYIEFSSDVGSIGKTWSSGYLMVKTLPLFSLFYTGCVYIVFDVITETDMY